VEVRFIPRYIRLDKFSKRRCRCRKVQNTELSFVPADQAVHALILSDSQLVVRQFSGEYQTYDPRLRDLLAEMKRIIARRKLRVELRWIPRERNKADQLLRKNVGS
jgi:ribonuclease HI